MHIHVSVYDCHQQQQQHAEESAMSQMLTHSRTCMKGVYGFVKEISSVFYAVATCVSNHFGWRFFIRRISNDYQQQTPVVVSPNPFCLFPITIFFFSLLFPAVCLYFCIIWPCRVLVCRSTAYNSDVAVVVSCVHGKAPYKSPTPQQQQQRTVTNYTAASNQHVLYVCKA